MASRRGKRLLRQIESVPIKPGRQQDVGECLVGILRRLVVGGQFAAGGIVDAMQRRVFRAQDGDVVALHPRAIVVELHHRASGRFGIAGEIPPDHGVLDGHADEREQGGREVDLAGLRADALGLDVGAEDQRRNVKLIDRDQAVPVRAIVMVRDDEKHGILP